MYRALSFLLIYSNQLATVGMLAVGKLKAVNVSKYKTVDVGKCKAVNVGK